MYKLKNITQNYDWGCKYLICDYFGISNNENLPMAEIWMGAHPSASSKILSGKEWVALDNFIAMNPDLTLGQELSKTKNTLPFLFKVLAADKPLSIQVHPNLLSAKNGFSNENHLGISLSDTRRNYKDDNHKPELIYALTKFLAMNGFRSFHEICKFFKKLDLDLVESKRFIEKPDSENLKKLFESILNLNGDIKDNYISYLTNYAKDFDCFPWATVTYLSKFWPKDVGLFMPLLLNVIELNPGEAMFLDACTPHAYLKGLGLEIMASSDNVLRAGLTNKHIDVSELVTNVNFSPKIFEELLHVPFISENTTTYQVPVDDFQMSILDIKENLLIKNISSPMIAFTLEGNLELSDGEGKIVMSKGESSFIPAKTLSVYVGGQGKLVIASVGNNNFKSVTID